jgi:hypothetical protein
VKSVEQELDVVQSDYTDRTKGVHAKLEDYYNRVISLFADKDAYEQVIFVVRLALIDLLTASDPFCTPLTAPCSCRS